MKITLPVPPSTNELFRNVPGRGRVITGAYQRWIADAKTRFWGVKYQMFDVPVSITVTLPDKRGPDCDNCLKAPIDLMKKMGVIKDDNRKHVRRVMSQIGDVTECEVEVVPV